MKVVFRVLLNKIEMVLCFCNFMEEVEVICIVIVYFLGVVWLIMNFYSGK